MSSDVFGFLNGIPWFAWISIVAIVCSSIGGIAKMRYKHLERIEMIRQGMNPNDIKPGPVEDIH